jgi:hypothetical protein
MTRRPRAITRRSISAAEVAALAGIDLEQRPLDFEADDDRGVWTIREQAAHEISRAHAIARLVELGLATAPAPRKPKAGK